MPNDSMAVVHEYVANNSSANPVAARTIQRILARDDRTTAELVDQVCLIFFLIYYFISKFHHSFILGSRNYTRTIWWKIL